jgi:hypothetical protein
MSGTKRPAGVFPLHKIWYKLLLAFLGPVVQSSLPAMMAQGDFSNLQPRQINVKRKIALLAEKLTLVTDELL